jgi:hypothetical protein
MTIPNSIFKKSCIIIQLFFMALIFSSCSRFMPNVKEYTHITSEGKRMEYTMWTTDPIRCNKRLSCTITTKISVYEDLFLSENRKS